MRKFGASWIALSAMLALGGNAAWAQSAQSEVAASAQEESGLGFDEIIVTGVARGQVKFDSSFAITTIAPEELKRLAPLSTADLLGQIPGVFAESTGGEASNVYRVRGIPNEGSFYAFQEDGIPVYPESAGFFFTGDGIMRTDLMTQSFEAVRGGTAPIYASNAAAIFNQVTRQGGDEPEAAAQLTLGDSGLYRLDGYWSGPVAERTYLAAGGFYRHNEGYRDNGFPNDQGGQFRVNLRHEIENGEVRGFIKYFNEQNVFLLPIPLTDPNTGASLDRFIDFFDGTLNTPALENATFRYRDESGANVAQVRDLSNGRQTEYVNTGFDFEYDLGGWRLFNQLRYTDGSVDFNALYSNAASTAADAYAATRLAAAQTAFAGTTRLGYAFAGTNGLGVYDPASDSGLVQREDFRNIQAEFSALTNDFRATREFELLGRHELTGGLFLSTYTSTGQWRSNIYLTETRSQPRLLDLVAYDASGAVTGFVTDDGVVNYSSTLFGGESETDEWSLYVSDTWHINDALSVEAGLRQTNNRARGYSRNAAAFDLGDATTLADDAARGFTGATTRRAYNEDHTAWTVGANYNFTDSLGAYVRASTAYRGPSEFNIILGIPASTTTTEQYEAGIKFDTPMLSVFATAFMSKFDPFTANLFETNPVTGAVGFIPFVGTVESPGVEVDFSFRPSDFFTLEGAITYNDAQIGNFIPGPGAPATATATNSDGNQPIRQPNFYGNIRPSLHFNIGEWDAIADVRYNFVGDRYVDLLNRTLLPAYQTVGAGISISNSVWELQLVGDNLTNEEGVTEGNPRTDQLSGQGTAVVNYGRPIFGRNFRLVMTRHW